MVGHDDKSTITAAQLTEFTNKITFLTNCEKGADEISEEGLKRLKEAKIPLCVGSIKKVYGKNGYMKKVALDSGTILETDFMFSTETKSVG